MKLDLTLTPEQKRLMDILNKKEEAEEKEMNLSLSVKSGGMITALCIIVERCGVLKFREKIDSFTVGWQKEELVIILGLSDSQIVHRLHEILLLRARNQRQMMYALLDTLARDLQRLQDKAHDKKIADITAEDITNDGRT